MTEREHILTALVEEVLGPRDGPCEVLPADQDPRGEYITGVLAPASASHEAEDIESEADEAAQEARGADPQEDQGSRGASVTASVFSPALDPRALPRSIGISFTLHATERKPKLEICSTWARYHEHRDGWKRQPEYFLTGPVDATQNMVWNAVDGVSLQLRSRKLLKDTWRVSLFLLNTSEPADAVGRPSVSEHVFQPQIRVACQPGTELVPVRQTSSRVQSEEADGCLVSEDASLNLVYRERFALARGHLCGAVWKAIDPERVHPDLPSPEKAPFSWTDGDLVPLEEREKFCPADVRTEMVPCYPINAPEMSWDENSGASPELDPDVLSEMWCGDEVKAALEPVVDGYRSWITAQEQLATTLSPERQVTAQSHLAQCRQSLGRMEEAIDTLVDDEDARLAFCFANKAIWLQSQWKTPGQVLRWRPFQLAFILLNIGAITDQTHPDRNVCDLLWFPTGGGKTEAYLGLAVFSLTLRRRRALSTGQPHAGGGTAVLSRYTLRLLTIQQFRRALGVITAAEVLRVQGLDSPSGPAGWRPKGYSGGETFLWGGTRFSAGLWVGGGVTPNGLHSVEFPSRGRGFPDTFIPGAIDNLKGADPDYQGHERRLRDIARDTRYIRPNGEPAQVLQCPCCQSVLAVPDQGFMAGKHELHLVFQGGRKSVPALSSFQPPTLPVTVDNVDVTPTGTDIRTLSITFSIPLHRTLEPNQIDEWWYQTIEPALGRNASLMSARPARPGYFILTYDDTRPCDFDIFCPSPTCELNQHAWAEQVPLARSDTNAGRPGFGPATGSLPATVSTAELPGIPGWQWQDVPVGCRLDEIRSISSRIPISALTTDDQIYHRCPSMVIATVDKFARLAFEPKAASLFGNVTHYHTRWGYYREGAPPSTGGNSGGSYRDHPPRRQGGPNSPTLRTDVSEFDPPDLILQDELHLIEGPLGSMVGLYETAIDELCRGTRGAGPKYIASTATVRQAEDQVQSLFDRSLAQFPPWGVSSDDRFFARDPQAHPLESVRAGRLYVGVSAPGKGAQTPIVRIWSRLLQKAHERRQVAGDAAIDQFWTLVGYFNAIRELAGALALLRQDIPERIAFASGNNARPLDEGSSLELSGRTSSLELPEMLERLSLPVPDADDAVLTTSMFGTGVDIDRLGLMVVHGQPKTTASYIQATGRVGRRNGGLIVTFLRASRPRDLDHYEFFTGYHHALYRYVEPITVAPFSPRARERGLGPLSVVLLRQAQEIGGNPVDPDWRIQQRVTGGYYSEAGRMATNRNSPEVSAIPVIFEARAGRQPAGRRPVSSDTATETASELDRWAALAQLHPSTAEFLYYELNPNRPPQRHVVLGDPQHQARGLDEAFENTPQSLREVEGTTGFQV